MQGQWAKFETDTHQYVARRNKVGERWFVIYGKRNPEIWNANDPWFTLVQPQEMQTTSNFKTFTLMSSDEVEELFYEVL